MTHQNKKRMRATSVSSLPTKDGVIEVQKQNPSQQRRTRSETSAMVCSPSSIATSSYIIKPDEEFASASNSVFMDEKVHHTSSSSYVCDACPYCDDFCLVQECIPCGEKAIKAALKAKNKCRWSLPTFTMCQVKRHNTAKDCWLVADGYVFNATPLLDMNMHPGGNECIVRKGGQDVTVDYNFHQASGQRFWTKLRVGRVVRCPGPARRPWYAFWS